MKKRATKKKARETKKKAKKKAAKKKVAKKTIAGEIPLSRAEARKQFYALRSLYSKKLEELPEEKQKYDKTPYFPLLLNDLTAEKRERVVMDLRLKDENEPATQEDEVGDSIREEQLKKAVNHSDSQDANTDSKAAELSFLFGFYEIPNNWKYWAGKPQLMAEEAIPLMCGMPPDIWGERESHRPKTFDPEWEKWEGCITRELEVSQLDGTINQLKTPVEWLDWGRANGLDKPSLKSNSELDLPDICLWEPFASAVEFLTNSQSDKYRATIKVERDCQAWLEGLMGDNSTPTKTKKEYQNEAWGKFKVGTNAFNRAWANAKASSDNLNWGKAGRRKGKP